MNSASKKIVAKVISVIAVSGSVFTLSATSATASPLSAVALAKPQASLPACRPPSLAHCYTEETMRSYLHEVTPMIVEFFEKKYKSMPKPRGYYFIPKGQRVSSPCRNLPGADDSAYEYCQTDDNIYLGQEAMWKFYDKDGDIAPIVGLAHEWGHHIQFEKHILGPGSMNSDESVRLENQADCVAGAWIQYASQQKRVEQEDYGSIKNLVKDIADTERPNRSHGKLEERRDAISRGINGGLEACNSYFKTPIITSQD